MQAHVSLSQLHEAIDLLPELLLSRHGSQHVNIDVAKAHSIEDTHGGLEALVALKMSQLASLGESENAESRHVGHADELLELLGVTFTDLSSLTSFSVSDLESVLAIVLPCALEVRLLADSGWHLVGHDHVLLFDDLRGELAESFVLSLESGGTLWSASIHTKDQVLILVGMSERVKDSITLSFGIGFEDVASLTSPAHLRRFIVEETILVATSPVLEAEPLQWVRLLTLTIELYGGPFGLQVVHGVLPSLTRIAIEVPTVLVLVLSPIGNAESLEDSPWASVECNISDTLKKGFRVEILSVDVMHDIGLLMELVMVNVLNTQTCLSCLLNVEPVSDEEKVWVDESQCFGTVLLEPVAGVHDELDPALPSLMSNVVLQWSSDLALAGKGTVDESI